MSHLYMMHQYSRADRLSSPRALTSALAFTQVSTRRSFILGALICLCMSAFSVSPLPAMAQISPIKAAPVTFEQRVDSMFGHVVGAVASVLFWDVAFWDNGAPITPRARFEGALLPDPIGWSVFTYNADAISEHDLAGQTQNTYQRAGLKIKQAWIVRGGKALLVRSTQDEAYLYARVALKGAVAPPLGPLKLPTGEWTSFTRIGDELVFGASDNRVYRLKVEADPSVKSRVSAEWSEAAWGLESPLVHVSARADGRYLIAVSADGSGEVIERVRPERVVLSWRASKTLKGAPVSSGFTADQVWVAFDDGIAAWSVQDGASRWSYSYANLNAAHTLEVGAELGLKERRDAHLISSPDRGAIIITDQGETLTLAALKLTSTHPLMRGVKSVRAIGDKLWVTDDAGAHQLSLSSASLFKSLNILERDATHAIKKSGNYLITSDAGRSTLWWSRDLQIPLIVIWLVFGALFFTLRMRLVNVRLFRHAIDVVRGKYTDPNAAGEVSHFQALTSALSATVGLGNIAGVAIAVSLGGPGATFWMIVAGFLGMASKFTECTLGQKYRRISPSGEVMGGAMHYLARGLQAERGLPRLGKALAILFCILCVGASFGGGNAFQVKQSLDAVVEVIPLLSEMKWVYGVVMAIAVGVVILGGIKSIAQTAEKIVPVMCGVYLLASLYILLVHASQVPHAISLIINGAFSPDALYGGGIGVLVLGFKRAAFSNEAGVGSAAIAHAAAKTDYPVREGVVALLEPFIDTIVVCTMTALVIVITGAYQNPEFAGSNGAALTSKAMGEVISFFPYLLSIAVILFAYSTMISWSYYGERCWAWLFGEEGVIFSLGAHSSLIYRLIFLLFAFLGSIVTATNVLDFSDLMILGMALPNILGLILLTRGVREDLDEYEEKLNADEFPTYEDH